MTRPESAERHPISQPAAPMPHARLIAALLGTLIVAHVSEAVGQEENSWHAVGAVEDGDPRVETTLVFDHDAVAPGDALRVGVHFEMDPDWHVYWRNPGQAALSTEVTFSSEETAFSPLQWPAPEVFQQNDGFITTYGYGHEVLLYADTVVPTDVEGQWEVSAVADYLACKVECIPGRAELRRTITVGDTTPSALAASFDQSSQSLPTPASQVGWQVETKLDHDVVRPGDTFALAVAASPRARCATDGEPPCVDVDTTTAPMLTFVPDRVQGMTLTPVDVRPHPSAPQGLVVVVQGRAGIDAVDADQTLRGVLYVTPLGGEPWAFDVEATLPRAPADTERQAIAHPFFVDFDPSLLDADTLAPAVPAMPTPPELAIWKLLLFAFFGGMILNLMPCVLPVLGIKATSFVRTVHEDRRSTFGHAGAYTVGILVSMWVLAGVIIGLQAGGTAVGWGFQLQQPGFIAVLCVVVVFFAAALLGLWHIGVDLTRVDEVRTESSGVSRSFLEGALAVVLATPCSAPLLGGAVGFALAASPAVILLTFSLVGLGLAAPFVALVCIPGLQRWIPRPGQWMVTMERILGALLLLAAVWLVWIGWQLAGTRGGIALIALCVATFAATAVVGRLQRGGQNIIPVAMASAAGLSIVGAIGVHALAASAPVQTRTVAHGGLAWQPWSTEAVDAEVAAGRTVFVDFTADWCITCKVNEHTVLVDDAVVAAFQDNDVALFVGDWTRRDDTIRAELARHGRAGVPLYIVHTPGETPLVLPELLTVDRVVSAVTP